MSIKDVLKISFANVRRGRLRTALTSAAISVGIASAVVLSAAGQGGKGLVNGILENLGIDGIMVFSGKYEGLTIGDAERLEKRLASVETAMPFETIFGSYNLRGAKKANAVLIGVDERADCFIDFKLKHGRLFGEADCKGGARVCLVDESFAREEYKRSDITGKKIRLSSGGPYEEFEIIGVIEARLGDLSALLGGQLPSFIYVPYSSVGIRADIAVSQIAVKTESGTESAAAVEQIKASLKKTNPNGRYFQVENISGYREEFDSVLDIVTVVLSLTACISLFVAGIGVMTSMLSSVNERRGEIGIYKAIGARKAQVAKLFLAEALILSLLGAALGLAAGAAVSLAAARHFSFALSLGARELLLPVGVTVLTGLLSGLFPAVKAARMLPVEAIRKD